MFFFLIPSILCWRGIRITYLGLKLCAVFLRVTCSDIFVLMQSLFLSREPMKKMLFSLVAWLNGIVNMILTWIRNTSIPSISNLLGSFDDAKSAWDMLAKRYSTIHRSMKYQLVVELRQLRQEPGQSINDYYDQLRFIWDQIDISNPTWACLKDAQQYVTVRDEFCLYEFLMSLHKDFKPIRG